MRKRRGLALITVLMMMGVLLIMVISLIVMSRDRLFSAQRERDSVSALYLAEAGVADSLVALEGDVNWAGTPKVQMQDGYYSVTLVNNLMGAAAIDSARGPLTVPPYTALLSVNARAGGGSRLLEALVSKVGSGMTRGAALQSSGRIVVEGDLQVDGVKSLTDPTAVPAGMHSTMAGTGLDLIKWTGGTAAVSGRVSSAGSVGGAINMAGASLGLGSQTGANPLPFVDYDIVGTIAAKSSAPAPAVNPTGVTTLPPGEFYVDGDLDLNGGDLVLKDTKLYVKGKLTINGSLSGTGSVYVKEDTKLHGDTSLTSSPTGNLALLSQGNVDIQGFNGSQFLKGLATADPQLQTWATQAGDTLSAMQALMKSNTTADLMAGGTAYNTIDTMRRTLGQNNGPTYASYDFNLFRKMHDKVAAQPASTQQAFMVKRLDELDRLFDGKSSDSDLTTDATRTIANTVADFDAGGSFYGGWFDAIIDGGPTYLAQMQKVEVLTEQINYDRLGSAYFQGLIYTRGSLYASQEVNVLGGVVAHGDPSGSARVAGTQTLKPGDIYLTGGSRVTAVEKTLGGASAPGAGELRVNAWLGQ